MHPDLSMKHFHLPKNQYYDSYKMTIPENFIACSIDPDARRHVMSSTMSTSAAKVSVSGAHHGLTACSIAGKSSVERAFNVRFRVRIRISVSVTNLP